MNTGSEDVHTTKRRKKGSGDTRADRKRELDRIAQRATRERTKNRIADLEQRLASLESGDKNSEVAQLTRTISELRGENSRYHTAFLKLRLVINEALGDFDGTASNRAESVVSGLPTPTPPINGTDEDPILNLPTHDAASLNQLRVNSTPPSFNALSQHQRLQSLYDIQGFRAPTPQPYGNIDVNSIYEFFEFGPSNPLTNPSPLAGRLPPENSAHLSGYQIAPDEQKWKTSDDAFQRGLQSSPLMLDFDEGVLARSILLGWDSIGSAIYHPILFALQCVDQRVFGKWTSRPQRLALMYICGCAMRWRSNPSDENKAKVPPWFLPRPAQDRIAHPLVIDFLVWPGLRERLVFEYEKYNVSGEFSYCFVEYFHFNWPYPDQQVAQYDPQTGIICGLSKIFKEYVFDLKNWTMLPGFFLQFPEMRADIDMWVESGDVSYEKASWM